MMCEAFARRGDTAVVGGANLPTGSSPSRWSDCRGWVSSALRYQHVKAVQHVRSRACEKMRDIAPVGAAGAGALLFLQPDSGMAASAAMVVGRRSGWPRAGRSGGGATGLAGASGGLYIRIIPCIEGRKPEPALDGSPRAGCPMIVTARVAYRRRRRRPRLGHPSWLGTRLRARLKPHVDHGALRDGFQRHIQRRIVTVQHDRHHHPLIGLLNHFHAAGDRALVRMTAEIDGALIQVREAPSFSAPGTAGPSASRRWSPQQAGSAHGRARARPWTASVRVPPMPSSRRWSASAA
jgi:hypothetical protein